MSLEDRLNIFTQKYDQFLNAYLMFAVVFLYHLLFIFQGLDLTDFGYHITHQIFSFTFSPGVKYIEPTFFLTDFIGGMWLSLIGHPNVLWAKLGGVFLQALNATIIFSILENYFEKRKVFFVLFVTSIFTSIFPLMYIHYFTFPAFLVNLELLVFNKIILSDIGSKKRSFYSFFLGFMVIPIILSRLSLILIFIIPIIFFIYWYVRKKEVLCFKKIIYPTIIGIFFSSILFGLFFWYLDILNYYFLSIIENISFLVTGVANKTSSMSAASSKARLINIYVFDSKLIINILLKLIFGIYILSIIKEKIGKRKINMLVILLTLLLILNVSLSVKNDFDIFVSTVRPLLTVLIGIIIVLAITYFAFNRVMNEKIDLLLISSIGIMIINPIGSNTGLFKSMYGTWLALPLAVLSICKIKTDIKNKRISSMVSLIPILLISLLCLSIFFNITYIYRDDINRLNLNTEFSDPSLKGVYSTSNRVEAVEELVYQIRKHSDKYDEILIANNIPIFHALTETKPSFGNPWIDLLSLDEIKEKQRKLEEKKELPKLFIYSKASGRLDWPSSYNDYKGDGNIGYLKSRYVNDLNYSLLLENEYFAIYSHSSI